MFLEKVNGEMFLNAFVGNVGSTDERWVKAHKRAADLLDKEQQLSALMGITEAWYACLVDMMVRDGADAAKAKDRLVDSMAHYDAFRRRLK